MARKITTKKTERALELNQLIGDQIRALRKRLENESGAKFGTRLTRYLGEPWSRQTVWEAEHGQRAFRVDELFALAQATGETVEFFLAAPANTKVQLKGGLTMASSQLVELLRAPRPTKKALTAAAALYELENEVEGYMTDALDRLQPVKERLRAIVEAEK